ncbi:hypothetical protein [Pseudovibrio sp. Ad37]|uniref:hypothetical protein n=1 Tax=Pseudovibrio sp. Ad37 TaxID=989422 RepID=UPI0007B2514C|nr:hypothetical protein [Pseudovibrio sp. Ad37]KZL28819.1 hypothetical protein PsAD37_00609 [Pseudovibrio sp. Ad37]
MLAVGSLEPFLIMGSPEFSFATLKANKFTGREKIISPLSKLPDIFSCVKMLTQENLDKIFF